MYVNMYRKYIINLIYIYTMSAVCILVLHQCLQLSLVETFSLRKDTDGHMRETLVCMSAGGERVSVALRVRMINLMMRFVLSYGGYCMYSR